MRDRLLCENGRLEYMFETETVVFETEKSNCKSKWI